MDVVLLLSFVNWFPIELEQPKRPQQRAQLSNKVVGNVHKRLQKIVETHQNVPCENKGGLNDTVEEQR